MISVYLLRSLPGEMFFLTSILFSAVNTVKIEKLVVPDLVQIGNMSDIVLDCLYSGVSDQFTLQWLFNGSHTPVYQWTPLAEPQVTGILDGRLDLTYRASPLVKEERRALRIVSIDPELSGEYTCRVLDQGAEARQTNTMLVFSTERDFLLEFDRQQPYVEVKCTARGLYPHPDLTLEHNSVMFPRQQQRIWRSEGLLYDAESTARLNIPPLGRNHNKLDQITCRLQLLQAGYTAIKKELLYMEGECSNSSSKINFSIVRIYLMLMVIYQQYLQLLFR
ncbi:uncharacterized protein LOC126368344 isoform X2 [Pectinophora gossypiella]|uniref:uncharacterized protein LOC126368344 isoform X2 n=1 Tax=Pectinophora gossypiella TaxID=13191 RepID=UPI00214ECE05|nr:uncharacterized protein LOC126368344 isoform X2 [Pectinophora gossypiella]